MILGEKIILGPFEKDMKKFLKWINDSEIINNISIFRPIAEINEEEWYNQTIKDENIICFAIKIKETNEFIGDVMLQLNWKDRFAILGILIGEKNYWNKGFGTETVELATKYAFETLNLHRVELSVYSFNERAKRCYIKAGFIEEGIKKEAYFVNGKYWDVIMMAKINKNN